MFRAEQICFFSDFPFKSFIYFEGNVQSDLQYNKSTQSQWEQEFDVVPSKQISNSMFSAGV